MSERPVTVRLNQQQRELVDKTIERGIAASPEDLFRKALKEYWRDHFSDDAPAGEKS